MVVVILGQRLGTTANAIVWRVRARVFSFPRCAIYISFFCINSLPLSLELGAASAVERETSVATRARAILDSLAVVASNQSMGADNTLATPLSCRQLNRARHHLGLGRKLNQAERS